jgi:Mg-chelatase subunit ChlD
MSLDPPSFTVRQKIRKHFPADRSGRSSSGAFNQTHCYAFSDHRMTRARNTRLTVTFSLLAAMGHAACGPGEGTPPVGTIEVDNSGGAGSRFNLKPGPLTEAELEDLRSSSCAAWSLAPEPHPIALQLVVDVSGSMSLPPESGTASKWETTREALRGAVLNLPPTVEMGALYFPNLSTERNCEGMESPCVPGPPAPPTECVNLDKSLPLKTLGEVDSPQRLAFDESLDAVNPAGGTPTHDAYALALDALLEAEVQNERSLVLITDGQPTFVEGCAGSGTADEPVDEEPIIAAIASAHAAGIRTFVIGSPGSEEAAGSEEDARPWLSRAALAGGTGPRGCSEVEAPYCHFDMSQEADFDAALQEALSAILGGVRSCSFAVPSAPEGQTLNPEAVNVVLNQDAAAPEVLGKDTNESCGAGWHYGESGGEITLCERSCEQLRSSTDVGLELFFGCESAEVIPPT